VSLYEFLELQPYDTIPPHVEYHWPRYLTSESALRSNTVQNKSLPLCVNLSKAEEYNGAGVSTWFISTLPCFPRIHWYLSRGRESPPSPFPLGRF